MNMLPTIHTASWSSPTSDVMFSLEQLSFSAPETRVGSRRQSLTPSIAGSAVARLPDGAPAMGSRRQSLTPSVDGSTVAQLTVVERPKTTGGVQQPRQRRQSVAARTPPPPTKFRNPIHWSERRGPHAKGHGQINHSLTHTQLGATAFGMPRWEQPRPDLAAEHARIMKRLFDAPPPSSPLSKFRPRTEDFGLPPRWHRTQHKHGAYIRGA